MSAAPVDSLRWSRRRWIYTIGLVFCAQVVLVFFTTELPKHVAAPPPFRTKIDLGIDEWSDQQLARLPGLDDPTLFALPSAKGFSGAAWLSFRPLEHRFSDWTQSVLWLELDTTTLGNAFMAFLKTNMAAPLLIAEQPLPSLPGPKRRETSELLPSVSTVRLEGPLAGRALRQAINPPSWSHTDVLTNTVVQVMVDADGDSQSQVLLSSCGSVEADQFALKLAANAQFQSLRKRAQTEASSEITWGKMIFQWHTTAPASTNTVSAARPP